MAMAGAPARVRRAPAPTASPSSTRAPLRAVRPRRSPPARRRPLVLALAAAVSSLLAVGAAHAYLIQGQVRLARLDQQLSTAQSEQRALQVQVAQLEAPARVVAQAQKDGLEVPPSVTDLPLVAPAAPAGAAPSTSSSTATGR